MMNSAAPSALRAPACRLGLVTGAILLVGIHSAAAQGNTSAKVSGKEYVLTKMSSFNAPSADARNPFWPIGWTPGPAVVQTQAVVYDVKPEDFVLTTTSVDYPPMAIINGKSYAVGETVPVASAPQESVKVKKITDGMVLLDNRGRELKIVPGSGTLKPRK